MAKIEWTKPALGDLESIYNYISLDSVFYANSTAKKILNRVEILLSFPRIGSIVPEFEVDDLRELILGNYRIVYNVTKNEDIRILRIYHSKMNS